MSNIQNPVPIMFTRTAAKCRTREQCCCQWQWNRGAEQQQQEQISYNTLKSMQYAIGDSQKAEWKCRKEKSMCTETEKKT